MLILALTLQVQQIANGMYVRPSPSFPNATASAGACTWAGRGDRRGLAYPHSSILVLISGRLLSSVVASMYILRLGEYTSVSASTKGRKTFRFYRIVVVCCDERRVGDVSFVTLLSLVCPGCLDILRICLFLRS